MLVGDQTMLRQLSLTCEREREREREFIDTNIKQFHVKIKLRRWDTEKNLQNRLSRRAPFESFINFYRVLKLMADLVRI